VADGHVYLGTRHGRLVAVDTATGEEAWRFTVGADIASSPAVANGTLYFGADQFYALDAATGERTWAVDLPEGTRWSNSSPAIVDGVVYVCSGVAGGTGAVVALDASDGERLWTLERDEPVFTDPAVANGSVYFQSDGLHRFAEPE
jgi:outer membrane protein assembly factor BamB